MYELAEEQEILAHERTVVAVLQGTKDFGGVYKEEITWCPSAQ